VSRQDNPERFKDTTRRPARKFGGHLPDLLGEPSRTPLIPVHKPRYLFTKCTPRTIGVLAGQASNTQPDTHRDPRQRQIISDTLVISVNTPGPLPTGRTRDRIASRAGNQFDTVVTDNNVINTNYKKKRLDQRICCTTPA
jgi:hypothetical protein